MGGSTLTKFNNFPCNVFGSRWRILARNTAYRYKQVASKPTIQPEKNLMNNTFRVSSAMAASMAFILTAGIASAQQEAGDKEIGLSGSAFFTHASPVTGSLNAQGSFGYFFKQSQYVGATVGPSLTFGGGQTT